MRFHNQAMSVQQQQQRQQQAKAASTCAARMGAELNSSIYNRSIMGM
jgi:hypothetical protein